MPKYPSTPPPRKIRLHSRPSQQPHRRANKNQYNSLILRTIPLKTLCENIRFGRAGADREIEIQAEFPRAVVAGSVGGAGEVVFVGGGEVVQREDCGICVEAGAFAEGCRCWD